MTGTSATIHLGISTCPNDTFAFSALMNRQVDWRGLQFEVELLDIEQLNERLLRGDFEVAKTSFHAALGMADSTVVLPSGSALGFGVGPLLLAARPNETPQAANPGTSETHPTITLCPGKHTTAALLFSLFYPQTTQVQHVVFSDIMPRLQSAEADFGVCIHEGRFTWRSEGLSLVEDLGTRWERETQSPLPLGGIVARRSLGEDTLNTVQAVIRDSLLHAMAEPDSALPTMRAHAQALTDDVLMKHVELYVNEWTIDLGDVGRSALRTLSQKAKSIGVIDPAAPSLEVLAPEVW